MNVFQQIKLYATEDIASVIKIASNSKGIDFKLKSLKFDKTAKDVELESEDDSVSVEAIATIAADGRTFEFNWEYLIDGDSIYIEEPESTLANELFRRYKESISSITSSSNVKRNQRIVAADEDFDEIVDDELPDEDSFSDSLDDLSDQVEDIQDKVDDIPEDDVNIDTDNNISNHYIAECDTCHGIFISAMIESDQKVDKISGVCPLCEKETDQYLRWIVKDVTDDEEH